MQTWKMLAVGITATTIIGLTSAERQVYANIINPNPCIACGFVAFNDNFTNNTGDIANDYHVKVQSSTNIDITQTEAHPVVPG